MAEAPHLFTPLTIGDITFRNRDRRLADVPVLERRRVCQRLAPRPSRQPRGRRRGAVIMEATAVEARGPHLAAGPGDLEGRAYRVSHAHRRRSSSSRARSPGIQLAHAGRKASTRAPWEGGGFIPEAKAAGCRSRRARSRFIPDDPPPHELSKDGIRDIVDDFAAATRRALARGSSWSRSTPRTAIWRMSSSRR